ncbi:MAG: hypothetical protein V2A57_03915 [Elusimicrobiota bacterium]|nr:hypothetical protein [Elusimicrobiota bacterium]
MGFMDFLLKDYITLLAGVLLIGGVILLFLVLNNLLKGSSTVPKDLQDNDDEDTEAHDLSQHESDISLLEAHLNSISGDISEIKKSLEKPAKQDKQEPSADIELLKDQLTKLNVKLDAIYQVLSALGKD